jgi:hypothetical protein
LITCTKKIKRATKRRKPVSDIWEIKTGNLRELGLRPVGEEQLFE